MKNNQQGASEEMILYARVLERGMYAGLILMFVTSVSYTHLTLPTISDV